MRWTSAIATALNEVHPDEDLSCAVQKCSAWTKQWRSRFVVLSGLKLSYSEKQGDPTKNRYVVAAADACLNDSEIRVVVSTGEWFILRFPDATLAKVWLSTIRRTQRRMHTLRWHAVAPSGDGPQYCGAISHCASNFEGKHILLFGGSVQTPKAGHQLQRELVMTSLVGDHPASVMRPPPLETSSNVKLRPAARELGASTILSNGVFVLYGGIAGRPLETLRDGWATNVATNGQWLRFHDDDSALLPALFGHTMHSLPIPPASTASPSSPNAFLIAGGIDSRFAAQRDVHRCTLGENSSVRVTRLPPLDKPRGMHAGVDLGDSTIVLVGGCSGRYNGLGEDDADVVPPLLSSPEDEAHKCLSVLSPADADGWRSVPLSPPLPPNTLRPGACAQGSTIFVWCRAAPTSPGSTGAPTLFSIHFSTELAVVTPFATRGDVPTITRGVSLHMSEDYCYLFGGNTQTIHRVLPPCSPADCAATPQRPSSAEEVPE